MRVGAFCGEGPPVPIPNTVVKLVRADNTLRATAREDRSAPTLLDSSTAEHPAVNRRVVGSNPTRGARHFRRPTILKGLVCLLSSSS